MLVDLYMSMARDGAAKNLSFIQLPLEGLARNLIENKSTNLTFLVVFKIGQSDIFEKKSIFTCGLKNCSYICSVNEGTQNSFNDE